MTVMITPEPITASVVGAGVGGHLSLEALVRSEPFHLVAAADLRPDVLAALATDYPGLQTFTDYRAMFAACPTDVVCVSTYPPSHEAIARDALALPLKGILVFGTAPRRSHRSRALSPPSAAGPQARRAPEQQAGRQTRRRAQCGVT